MIEGGVLSTGSPPLAPPFPSPRSIVCIGRAEASLLRRGSRLVAALAFTLPFLAASSAHAAPPNAVKMALSADGHLGVMVVAGPFRPHVAKGAALLDASIPGLDEGRPALRAGNAAGENDGAGGPAPPWTVLSSEGAGLDLKSGLGLGASAKDKDVLAYAGFEFIAPKRGKYTFLVTADDGVRLSVDGKKILSRDEPRPAREDDDAAIVDLSVGSHTVLLKLHQRDGLFGLRIRILDEAWRPAGFVSLPGATADDVDKMVRRGSFVSVDRGLTENGYEPRVSVRFPDGLPAAPAIRASARLVTREGDVLAKALPAVLPAAGSGGAAIDNGEVELAFPPIEGDLLAKVEDRPLTFEVDVGGRLVKAPFFPRRATRLAARRALFVLENVPSVRPSWLHSGTFESVDFLRQRLVRLVSRGDADLESQAKEARELDAAAASMEAERDPYDAKTGFLRRAYRSPVDGELSPYGLYVPPSYRPGARRTYPLIVALHGLNGKPMSILRYVFGGDDPKRDSDWKERHTDDLPPLDAFVLTPNGHGNAMYRQLGQDDVMRALDEVMALYPIDPTHVSITGPSMGGIGAAALAFRHPDRFAASEPLCGYHSMFVRRDMQGKSLRPWERFLAEERSNTEWAWNGRDLPLYIVHGTLDTPVENSGALIDRYETLKYSVVHEHPALGHNVWAPTYQDLKGAKWLLNFGRNLHPRSLRFRTARVRDGKMAWASIEELSAPDAWGELEAQVRSKTRIEATTRGIAQLRLERDGALVDLNQPLEVALDGTTLSFAPGEALLAHREGATWKPGPMVATGPRKRAGVSGPFRDIFHEPLLFVYGASDPLEARTNEEVARGLARIRYGVDVRYPILSDREFLARGESIANDKVLVLVGGSHTNAVLRAIESELPIRVSQERVVIGGGRIEGGRELGAAFVVPNPRRPDRILAVVAGATPLGTLRALSLPDLLPDFVVYDERVKAAHGQMVLGAGSVLAGGFFKTDWSLPKTWNDPLSRSRPVVHPEPVDSAEAE